jgi:hypothetical protein
LHVTVRAEGRTRSYNVPAERVPYVERGVAAWLRFQEIARELAERNRLALGLGRKIRRSR